MIPIFVPKYLKTKGITASWKLEGNEKEGFHGAVVIPALAENAYLFQTLQSLAQNPEEILARFLIIVVVNNRLNAPPEDQGDNQETLRRLRDGLVPSGIQALAWVDASSPGRELPRKGGGVGMARKIGFDLALPRLDYEIGKPILVSLDADTQVRSDYLPSVVQHFQKVAMPGAVLPFCHQRGATPEEEKAIGRYELFLRTYVLGLSRAGSPYAFHTIGSAMACSAEGYVRMGGMNTRMAAEDFYFLQQLARTGGVAGLKGTVVYPSARPSTRVPFGTGRSVSRLLANEMEAVLFYRAECFQILKDWLLLISRNPSAGGREIRSQAGGISPCLGDYLDIIQFSEVWEKLKNNFHGPAALQGAFHGWFDGLKTMKLIHHLSAGPHPRGEPEGIMPGFLRWAGLITIGTSEDPLSLMRRIQNGADDPSAEARPGMR